ncbi:ribosome biogenesis GTPase YlqF [Ruminococcus sp. Marseille-P6503]|uniref:ribosome biogenesis GTPase YlqF n=1 Tax=Ruminococcus sp. Marseille-P6503 TaxID=2364796 RepID=UPI000F52F785|nr:ribosome biogenesis GTPase YlqF [Ruminococcus sp. Marseille-P6503]
MSEVSNIQWFPGHMAKTRRIMQSNLKLVDVVVEITDARIPYSSRNPEMDRLVGSKPRLLLLNKADSADETVTSMWIDHYKRRGVAVIATDCRSGKNVSKFYAVLNELMSDKLAQWETHGMKGRPIRIMIVGIPNVGKSSFINRLAGARRAKVEDRPGVTRGKQWVSLDGNIELLDMPGVLWPKFEDKNVGERLAFTGAVKDDIMDMEYLACRFLEFLNGNYPGLITQRYGVAVDDIPENDPDTPGCVQGFEILERIGRKRGFLLSGGEINTERAAITVIDEFRSGKIGRLSLEKPNEIKSGDLR